MATTYKTAPSTDPYGLAESLDESLDLEDTRVLTSATGLRGSFASLERKDDRRPPPLRDVLPHRWTHGAEEPNDGSDDSITDNDPSLKLSGASNRSTGSGGVGGRQMSVHDYAASSCLSLSDDEDWDIQATKEHERILERLEDQLYRDGGDHVPEPSVSVQNWSRAWPHLRVRGVPMTPPLDTAWSAYPPPSAPSRSNAFRRPPPQVPTAASQHALSTLAVMGSKVKATRTSSAKGNMNEEVFAQHGTVEEVFAQDNSDAQHAGRGGNDGHADGDGNGNGNGSGGGGGTIDAMDTQGKANERRARRLERAGFPPLSPAALQYHSVMTALFDDVFEWILPSLRPLLTAASESDLTEGDIEHTSVITKGPHTAIPGAPIPHTHQAPPLPESGQRGGPGLTIRQFPLRPRGDTFGDSVPLPFSSPQAERHNSGGGSSDGRTSSRQATGQVGQVGQAGVGVASEGGGKQRRLLPSTSGNISIHKQPSFITRSVSSGNIDQGIANNDGTATSATGGGSGGGVGAGEKGEVKYRAIGNNRAPSMAAGFRRPTAALQPIQRGLPPPLPHHQDSGGGDGVGVGVGGEGWYDHAASRPTTVNTRGAALQDSQALDFPLRVQTALPASRTTTSSRNGPKGSGTPVAPTQSTGTVSGSSGGAGGGGLSVWANAPPGTRQSRTSGGRRIPPPPPRRRKLGMGGSQPLPHTQTKT